MLNLVFFGTFYFSLAGLPYTTAPTLTSFTTTLPMPTIAPLSIFTLFLITEWSFI